MVWEFGDANGSDGRSERGDDADPKQVAEYIAAMAAELVIGFGISVPTSDHVPEQIYAVRRISVGMPAMAEAVS